MDLLAPAGNFENFHAALDAGADAVYVGAPGLNARNTARDINLETLGSMISIAHDQERKIYIAVNSLVRESDIPQLIKTLSFLEIARPDGLIIQDLGIVNLVMDFFPSLVIHASTLMTAHNLASVKTLASLGFSRVVIARELTLKEITRIIRQSDIEIEVFIHGAMCFSYSGLCLFSSYLGGKSGLRGKCVQPCRRKYDIAGGGSRRGKAKSSSGYLFSMNDLSGLELVPDFLRIGVSSLKIEGRLRSATYVENIVKAYRMVIDAGMEPDSSVIEEASRLIPEAMGRKTSTGYFTSPQPKDAIIQHHSGNIGSHLGRISSVDIQENRILGLLFPKVPCSVGDRLRIHLEKSGKRLSFTLTDIFENGTSVPVSSGKEKIRIVLPDTLDAASIKGQMDLFLVDKKKVVSGGERPTRKNPEKRVLTLEEQTALNKKIKVIELQVTAAAVGTEKLPVHSKSRKGKKSGPELWLRVDTPHVIFDKPVFIPDRYVLNLEKDLISAAGQIKRFLGRNMRSVVWALPPVLSDTRLGPIQKTIATLIQSGYRSFQIAHVSQIELFEGERVQLYGDYTLNVLNSQALKLLAKLEFRGIQAAIEADRACLKQAVHAFKQLSSHVHETRQYEQAAQLGLTVYGAPPLFVSRIGSSHLSYGRTLISPKKEQFVVERKEGFTQTRPKKPFSLLPYRKELYEMGFSYFVIDLTGIKAGKKELLDLKERISGKEKGYKLPTFNYLGTLE